MTPKPPAEDVALLAAREAALLAPTEAGAQARLGRALLAAGQLDRAIEALQRAVRLEPDNASLRLDLGRAWLAAADPEKAGFHLRRALDLDPADAAGAGALLTESESGAAGLSPDFVRTLFDQYAARFDAEMRGTLAYRAPAALRDLMLRVVMPVGMHAHAAPSGALDVLDLGCGTGLSGLAVRDFARTLVGVDLSSRMAERARARGIYDQVIVGDMIEALRDAPASFDLIVAVDALGYVGDLAPLLNAARSALRPGGRFAATVEEAAGEPPGASPRGFALGAARRFRHGADYLRREATNSGWTLEALEKVVLRRDRGQPVAGLAFVLRT